MGGKFHVKINMSLRPVANKYLEGKMKRTLKRELKELEFAEWKASRKAIGWQDCCLFLVLLQTCVQCLWCVKKSIMAHLSALSAAVCTWKWIRMARHACVYAPVILYTCAQTEDSVCGAKAAYDCIYFTNLPVFEQLERTDRTMLT